jgi:hypothetical protein
MNEINMLQDFSDISKTLQEDDSGEEVRKIVDYLDSLAKRTEMEQIQTGDMEEKRILGLQHAALLAAKQILTEVWEGTHKSSLYHAKQE